jgi:phosphate-selective porin OprO/OprP
LSTRRRFVRTAAAFALVATATAAWAQPASPPLTAGWQEGFIIQSANGDFRLGLGLTAQADGRFVLNDEEEAFVDTFTIRKARPSLNGRIARFFDFQVMPDFGGGTTVLQDAYVDVRFGTAFRVRAGKSKTPIGYEILVGDPFVLFPERSLASSLVPNRDVGFGALGELLEGRLAYQGGVFNGVPDGTSSSSDVDASDDKDLAGRVVVQPFRRAVNPGRLNGLGFAFGASRGSQRGALPAFRTSVGQRYFGYAAGVAADGLRTRITPSVFYYSGPLGVFTEYVRSGQDVSASTSGGRFEVVNQGWDVTASLVLTGEPGADRGVRPRTNFDPAAGEWGAVQLVLRYGRLAVDEDVFAAGFAAPGSSSRAKAFAVGLNWYPAYFLKYYAAFERTAFDETFGFARPAEHSFIIRAQLAF